MIVILLIFRIGGLLNAGFEQILLLYSPPVYEVADILDTYMYRSGILSLKYSFATAVGLFKALLAAALLLGSNVVAKRLGHTGNLVGQGCICNAAAARRYSRYSTSPS